jgi:predicted site-specific integrase-resolvase
MKSKDVLKLLNISRVTLCSYVKFNKIKVTKLDNGYYDYDDDSVYKLMKKDIKATILYARVSTYKQKNDLDNQVNKLIFYCNENNIKYDNIYRDIDSGLDLDRNSISGLIDDVLHYKIKTIYITNKDRLTRLSFKTLINIFNRFGTNVITINDEDKDTDNEVFEELISLVHIFSTKMYSNRCKKKLINMKSDLKLFNGTD